MPETTTVTFSPTEVNLEKFFGDITYDLSNAGKEYKYEITETSPFGTTGTNDGPITVIVTVGRDTGTGQLTTSVSYTPNTQTITNTYTATGTAKVGAKKALSAGSSWPAGVDNVTFTLSKVTTDAPMPAATTVTFNSSEVNIEKFFGDITYDLTNAGKEYKYKIEETGGFGSSGSASGPINVIVTVGQDNGTGVLNTTVTYDPADQTITNTYGITGKAKVGAKKALAEGSSWPADIDSVTFTLSKVTSDAPMPNTTTVTFSPTEVNLEKFFGDITYDLSNAGKEYKYRIAETEGFGAAGSASGPIEVTVKVGDDTGTGQLTTTVTYDPANQTITNTYTAAGTAKVGAKKALAEGSSWPAGVNNATFTLSKVTSDAPMPDTTTVTFSSSEVNVEKFFGEIAYDLSNAGKEYKYEITETSAFGTTGTNDGPIKVTVKVGEDDGSGQLTTTVTYDPANRTITNTYTAAGTAKVGAKKALSQGSTWPAGVDSVTFTLSKMTSDAPMPETTTVTFNSSEVNVEKYFSDISFDMSNAGKEYQYKIEETSGFGAAGTISGPINVTISVGEDTGTGVLNTTVTYDPTNRTITNHQIQNIDVTLSAVKSLIGPALTDQKWGFKLTATDGGPMPASCGTGTECDISNTGSSVPVGTFTFSYEDIDKTYNYTLTEFKLPESPDNISIDPAAKEFSIRISLEGDNLKADVVNAELQSANTFSLGTFTNTYVADGSIILSATKTMKEGSVWPKDKEFTLILASDNDANASRKLSGLTGLEQPASQSTPNVYFPELSFTMAEAEAETVFKFVITEKDGGTTSDGITYSAASHKVSVKPVLDTASHTITVTASVDGGPYQTVTEALNAGSFENDYQAAASMMLAVTKKINVWPEGVIFSFAIAGDDSDSQQKVAALEVQAVTNTTDPAEFGAIRFDQTDIGKTFKFSVSETNKTLSYITYAETPLPVTVKVEDNGDGTLKLTDQNGTEYTYDTAKKLYYVTGDDFFLENAYHAGGKVILSATKSMAVADTWPEGQKFILQIAEDAANDPQKYGTGAKEIEVAESTSETPAAAIFSDIVFDENDLGKEFRFTISEKSGVITCVSDNPSCVTYSEEEYTVLIVPQAAGASIQPVVTITKKSDGSSTTITPTLSNEAYNVLVGAFENSYTAKGSAELEVTKALEGAEWPEGRTAIFTLTAMNGGPMPDGKTKVEVNVTEPGATVFPEIEFSLDDAGKVYYYQIEETTGFGEGWYESSPVIARVTVGTDKGDGSLTASAIAYTTDAANYQTDGEHYSAQGTITNTYNLSGEAELKVQKQLSGRDWQTSDEFTFSITPVGSAPKPVKDSQEVSSVVITASTGNDHTESFGTITFTKEGEYKYIIKETTCPAGGLTCDLDERTITFKVKDDKKGHLIADGTPLEQTETFINAYTAFGTLKMRSSKTIAGSLDGVTESHELPFELWHKSDHDKHKAGDTTVEPLISRVITILDNQTLEFDYPVDFTLESNPDPEPPVNPHDVIHVESLPDAVAAGKATMRMVGGKRVYTINYVLDERTVVDRELKPPDQTYDIIVEVVDEGNGVLRASSLKYRDINKPGEDYTEVTDPETSTMVGTFLNRERHNSAPTILSGRKMLSGRELTDEDNAKWTAVISCEPEGCPLPASDTAEIKIVSVEGETHKVGSYSFGEMVFGPEHLGECTMTEDGGYTCASKEYTYTIIERGEVDGVTNDNARTVKFTVSLDDNGDVQVTSDPADPSALIGSLTFTNEYVAGSTSIQFGGKKIFSGYPEDQETPVFTITLAGEDGTEFETQVIERAGAGPYQFDSITYTEEGEYHYVVTETIGNVSGVTYDTNVYHITVKVTDNQHGQLVKDVKITNDKQYAVSDPGELDFTNIYSEADVQFHAIKLLYGRELKDGEFTFVLQGSDGTLEMVTNNGREIVFTPIHYEEPGSYDYTIKEIASGPDDVIFDTRVFRIHVEVSFDAYGKLTAVISGDDITQMRFVNRHREKYYRIEEMPETGFSAVHPQALPDMPMNISYKPLEWTLQIPTLSVSTEIVQIPLVDGRYPVTWLGSAAGLLEGSALPGEGMTIIAGHNHLNTMESGPFALLGTLETGDRIFVTDPENELQTFVVYANEKIDEADIDALYAIIEARENSITMITCEDERPNGGYENRRIIAAAPLEKETRRLP